MYFSQRICECTASPTQARRRAGQARAEPAERHGSEGGLIPTRRWRKLAAYGNTITHCAWMAFCGVRQQPHTLPDFFFPLFFIPFAARADRCPRPYKPGVLPRCRAAGWWVETLESTGTKRERIAPQRAGIIDLPHCAIPHHSGTGANAHTTQRQQARTN